MKTSTFADETISINPRGMSLYLQATFDEIVCIEESLEDLERASWKAQIDYRRVETHLFIFDHNRKRIILVPGLFAQAVANLETDKSTMTIASQIYSWIIGSTKGSPRIGKKSLLEEHDVELFLQGDADKILAYRAAQKIPEGNYPSPDWTLLHHPLEALPSSRTISRRTFQKIGQEFPAYTYWLAYGVVNRRTFQHTPKMQIVQTVENVLGENGFDITKRVEAKDIERSYEPILRWASQHVYPAGFEALVGVDLGYDNGRSAYYLGIGLSIPPEDLVLPKLSKVIFSGYDDQSDVLFLSGRWEHHLSDGIIVNKMTTFFNKSYEKLFDYVRVLIELAKTDHYASQEASQRLMLATDPRAFKSCHEKLKINHVNYSSRYGYTRYTHFLSWIDLTQSLAQDMDKDKIKLISRAQFIAQSILSLPKLKIGPNDAIVTVEQGLSY